MAFFAHEEDSLVVRESHIFYKYEVILVESCFIMEIKDIMPEKNNSLLIV